jgi:hypothetical protein
MPQALDLTREFPRSPFDAIAGYFWLPRLIDKTRAHFAGTRGEYAAYPCPSDQRFISFYGLDTDALGEVIKSGASDAEIAAWVNQHGTKRTPEEVAGLYKAFATPPADPGVAAYLAGQVEAIAPGQDIKNFSQLICLEENHPYPANLA